jgi:DNA polymerase III subunit gamma/tau
MSYANGLSPFRGKINRFIIPVTYFVRPIPSAQIPLESVAMEPTPGYALNKKEQIEGEKPKEEKTRPIATPQTQIENPALRKGVSSLSISSIQLKKEAERNSSAKKEIVNTAQQAFSQETLTQLWKTYTLEKNNQGENNIAALLEMSQPKLLEDYKILLKTSSTLSKVELTKELTSLLAYLNKAVNNYKISIEIELEERKSEEYVFGVRGKYEYLKKINPEIEVLKKEFDLDL